MHVAYITVKGGPKRGGGGDSKRGFPWGRGRGRNWFNIVINGPPCWILKVYVRHRLSRIEILFLCKRFICRKCFYIGEIGSIGC